MPDRSVTPLRLRAPSGYTDRAALNDIHALLTSQDSVGAALTDIALILARTGRPMVAARDIEVTTAETVLGWPVACVQSGDASVVIGQAPAGPGLLIEITAKSAAERDALRVTLDGLTLHPLSPPRPAGRNPYRIRERSNPMSALNERAPATPPEAKPPAGADQPPGGHDPGGPAGRPVIPVAQLAAHPGNVRRDLDLSPGFLASVQANGILVPLRVTPGGDGGYRVIDGHRRLAAAIQAGLAEVPADIAADRAGDEPGQYLDMWTANRHHAPLTLLEEADALFSARDAGAAKTRIRRSTGLKAPQLDAALSAARLSPDTRAAVDALPQDLTLEDLAILAEFDGQDEAIARLTQAAGWGHSLEHQAELIRQEQAARAEHERLRRDLQDAGVALTDSLPPGGQLLAVLSHDGQDLTPEAHASCPGRGAYFRPYDQATPVHYCADPNAHSHAFRYATPGTTPGTGSPAGPGGQPDPGPPDASRRVVIDGNRAWAAAAEVRKRWLPAHLFARRTAPREAALFAARQLLAMPDPLRAGLATAHGSQLFAQITGHDAGHWLETCDTAAGSRLPLLILAPIVTAYELAMSGGEGRNTWRPGRYSPCPRDQAGHYFAFLASVGYQLSGIEQAVADGDAWTGDTPPGDPLTGPAETGSAGVSHDGEPQPAGEPLPGDEPAPGGEPATGRETRTADLDPEAAGDSPGDT